MFGEINEIAIIVSALLAVAVAHIWYSPLLFGQILMQSIGKAVENDFHTQREPIYMAVNNIVIQIVFFYLCAQAIQVFAGYVSVYTLGAFIFGLISVHLFTLSIFEHKQFRLAMIHIGYVAICVFGGLSVISFWPW